MALPPSVLATLKQFGVTAPVRAAIAELHRSLSNGVVEALAQLCEQEEIAPGELTIEQVQELRSQMGEAFLYRHHSQWLQGENTLGFWRPWKMEGGASGWVTRLGQMEDAEDDAACWIKDVVNNHLGPNQPSPRGILLLGQNTHKSGRKGSFTLDLVPSSLEEALALNRAAGQQHTMPGSIGATSGTRLMSLDTSLIWEIQPNLHKPIGAASPLSKKAWRRHRNWHLITLVASLRWIAGDLVLALKGDVLKAVHEVNRDHPLTDDISSMHERSLHSAAKALGRSWKSVKGDELNEEGWSMLAEETNPTLLPLLEEQGPSGLFWALDG